MRAGRWKLHFPHGYPAVQGKPASEGRPAPYAQKTMGLSLFDLEADVGETTDVADKHPDVVERLEKLAEQAREELGDSATKREGKGVRPPGVVKPKKE